MPEESTTPDPVELTQRLVDAMNARDLDAVMSAYAPGTVLDLPELGIYEGRAAVRGFVEEWVGAYEEFEVRAEEIRDLGN